MGAVLIHLATSDELPGLAFALESARDETGHRRGSALRIHRLGSSEVSASALLDARDLRTIVASDAEDVIGFALLNSEALVLEAVWVMPARRRQGIATKLVAVAERLCWESSRGRLHVVAAAGNRAEKLLYERLGYRGELIVMTKPSPTEQ